MLYDAPKFTFLGGISDIVGTDVNMQPEHHFKILIDGRNMLNDVSNKLIVAEKMKEI